MKVLVSTPVGEARVTRFPAAGRRRALVILGHGAGGGVEAADLQALAGALPARGVEVLLVEQPWRVAGKRIAPAPKTLDIAWRAVLEHVNDDDDPRVPLIVGGRSAGARVACRTGSDTGACGVIALAFPLHPPGKPEKSRAGELSATGLPTLIVQGGRDPFGAPAQFPALPATHRLVGLPAGNHEFAVRRSEPPVLATIVDIVAGWVGDLVGTPGAPHDDAS
ncbi:hydrolase [Actinocrinis puniceicyclus]|uniref:Hydrolase n=1 Tax=Actinocrinis puniceicyclus TaxID=977794 RepID=A0A8J8BD15_9ACTN|nr:alpha/beta family hydrolase [Actinocrinis puniceicyclus]MBS2964105.1 hydrolase [Actinocrinis puniceicyclus]